MRLIHLACLAGTAVSAAPTVPAPVSPPPPGSYASDPPVISLDYASYRGTHLPDANVDQFLGMRFAAPPLDDLRFRAPQEPPHEDQIQDASEFRPICLGTYQSPSELIAEDCLFVNVFKPAAATAASKLPVWVLIQGGGYATNGNANFNGTDVIRHSGDAIVYVNFNYRVGVLGFLASEDLRHDGALNAGLLDQRLLLRWVKKYITQFGGDPDHVVIHGDSAGAGSVSYHLTAYAGHDPETLFIGAVLESPFWPTQRTVAATDFQYRRLLAETSCSTLACLRTVPVAALNDASSRQASRGFPEAAATDPAPLWYWLPVVDGDLVRDHMYALFESGRFRRDVPVLIGDDTNEGTVFVNHIDAIVANETAAQSFMRANYPRLQPWQLDLVDTLYPRDTNNDTDSQPTTGVTKHGAYFSPAAAAYGDSTFVCAGNAMTEAISVFAGCDKNIAWNYRYNVLSPSSLASGLGVPHVAEIGAVLGPDSVQGQAPPSLRVGAVDAAIVPVTMAYFISFVRFLDPNVARYPGSPMWKSWRSEDDNHDAQGSNGGGDGGWRLRLQINETAMEQVPSEQVEKCMMWRFLSKSMDI